MTHAVKTYLGFDVGKKRTGISVGNSLTKQATGLETMHHHSDGTPDWQLINQYVAQYTPDTLIVGVPFTTDGKTQEMVGIARDFCKELSKRYELSVREVNEYLSSNEAKKQLKYNHAHKNAKRAEVDKRAAQIILQTWLNTQ